MLLHGLCSHVAYAKNWHLMLIPESQMQGEEEQLNNHYHVLREEIANRLNTQREQIINTALVFENCDISLCAQNSKKTALEKVTRSAPSVDLVLFFGKRSTPEQAEGVFSLQASLVDPLSLREYDVFDLSFIDSQTAPDRLQLKSMAADLGTMIAHSLQNLEKQHSFYLDLVGFTIDEIAPFASFVMAKSITSKLTLLRSEKINDTLFAYLPTISSHYQVTTALTQSQFNHLLLQFFEQESIDVINEYQVETNLLAINRIGNPYTPSLVSSVLLLVLLFTIFALFIRRQYLQNQLEDYAKSKSVDSWLAVYDDAKAPWYMLKGRWKNQHNYWLRLQRESSDLEKQAKLFFDAGDLISAKLFISKSLNINADAPVALSLVEKISTQEANEQAFSSKEQGVRNKVAKAMNNYRANKPIKALRQAYKALEESQSEKKLKRQHKAIKRLIQKINVDFTQSHEVLELTDMNTNEVSIVSTLEELLIGRQANKPFSEASQALVDRSLQIFIEHKALSRVPKQCKFSMTEHGFFISDLGSTNGTFLQGKQLKEAIETPIVDKNHVYLGSASELSAVKLDLRVDGAQSVMSARIAEQLTHTLDRAELIKIWPNFMHAMQSSFVMTKSDVVLAIDSQQNVLRIVSLYELEHSISLRGILRIWLGENASIAPLAGFDDGQSDDAQSDDDERTDVVRCNDEKLLGIVPLILPCDVIFKEHHVRIDEYFEYGRPLQHIDHLAMQVTTNEDES